MMPEQSNTRLPFRAEEAAAALLAAAEFTETAVTVTAVLPTAGSPIALLLQVAACSMCHVTPRLHGYGRSGSTAHIWLQDESSSTTNHRVLCVLRRFQMCPSVLLPTALSVLRGFDRSGLGIGLEHACGLD